MLVLPGYETHTQIYESLNSCVYRAIRTLDSQPNTTRDTSPPTPLVNKRLRPLPSPLKGENERGGEGSNTPPFPTREGGSFSEELGGLGLSYPSSMDGQPVILKLLKQDYPTPEELVRYRQEYEITHNLNLEGVCRSLSLEKYQNTFVIVFEDFGGESLKSWMSNRKLKLEDFLQIAIATTASLAQVHAANIIHKDINPSNIVYNPNTQQLKLIDFGISTVLSRENQTLKNPNVLQGTLAYMSPSQTGRMNRSLDYRTDFYSLGVTFYELLTNKLPFETTDALELVHCHIAKQPLPPSEMTSEIPQVVSGIVMKLMAKTAEERYQSAFGIKADLEECLNQLHQTGSISDFPLACQDIADKFQIPQKLYGRKQEIATLLSAFERASDRIEMMLIGGYSGIGKSALVQELYKPITQKQCYFISGKFDQYKRNIPYSAIVSAFQELIKQLLTESVPESPTPLDIQQALSETTASLNGKSRDDLFNLSLTKDSDKLATMRILASMGSPTYQAAPPLFLLIVLSQVNLSIKYGNSIFSPYAYVCYGLILNGVVLDIQSAYQFGQLSLTLVEKLNALEVKTEILFVAGSSTLHGKVHARETLPLLLEGYQSGLENGHLEYGGYAAMQKCQHSYFIGQELTGLEREMAKTSKALTQLKQKNALSWNRVFQQAVLTLVTPSNNSCSLLGEIYNEEKLLSLLRVGNDRTGLHYFYVNKLILCYLFEEYPQALENATQAQQYLDGVTAFLVVPVFHFYDSLARLAVYSSVPNSEQARLLLKVTSNQEKMPNWVHNAPMNFQHKYDLVEAEKAGVLGQIIEAMDFYERAVKGAKDNGYIQEEALAYELAAKFYLSKSKELSARAYMQEARYCYQLWGATAKVKDLETRYQQLFAVTQPGIKDTKNHTTTTGSGSGSNLDIATVMKANQAISGEIVLDKLLSSLMKILIENAGSQKGYLILASQGKLLIEAEGSIDSERVSVLQSLPLENCHILSEAIVNYVARTKESVVLNDATREGQFINAPYIKENQPKSILCVPLINQGKLISIVYLENNLTTGAFTPERVEVLKLLSGQAAISIENAQLYREVRENESRLAQFLEAVPVGIGILDSDGKPYYINRVAQQLLGKGVVPNAKPTQIAEVYQAYIAGTDQVYPNDKLPIVRALRGESSTVNDMEIRQQNKIVPLEVWGTPIYDKKGNVTYAINAFQDITERKKAETERQRFTNQLFQLNKAYERFVPRQFLQFLEKSSIIDVELGDQVQLEMSVLFFDIRDFTALSEKMTPEDNFKFINSYLSRMEPAITENHGFIDKYIGDAIMALFSGEADNAVKAGITMLHRLAEYNQHRANSGFAPIQNGIGINTGSLMLGTVGGQNRMDGTVISDSVNLASRIESLTKEYGVSLLISQQTFSHLQNPTDYAIRQVDRVKVKGKSEVVTVYEVFDSYRAEVKEKKLATLQTYTEACSYYNLNAYAEAAQRFEDCLRQNPSDRVAQIYLKRTQAKI